MRVMLIDFINGLSFLGLGLVDVGDLVVVVSLGNSKSGLALCLPSFGDCSAAACLGPDPGELSQAC